jgi:hypothetical protein
MMRRSGQALSSEIRHAALRTLFPYRSHAFSFTIPTASA